MAATVKGYLKDEVWETQLRVSSPGYRVLEPSPSLMSKALSARQPFTLCLTMPLACRVLAP